MGLWFWGRAGHLWHLWHLWQLVKKDLPLSALHLEPCSDLLQQGMAARLPTRSPEGGSCVQCSGGRQARIPSFWHAGIPNAWQAGPRCYV